ncbi:kinase-like domain-containing protein [Auriculariales sp. MPI-PUGE-AT-0066]|nr:kinase-like domain-containing protein [Auriculariales sp. MPI-PUGE-AT-0066]
MAEQAGYPIVAGYTVRDRIGGGGFAEVFRAIHYASGAVEACKIYYLKPQTTATQRKDLEKEIRVQSFLKHNHVLALYNKLVVEIGKDERYIPGVYMLMELAVGGDLFDKICPDVGVEEDTAHLYFEQLVSGMRYIHSTGVCHRDLKPENILLSKHGNLKISDFGLCAVFRHKDKTRQLTERCGSRPYVAPELAMDQPYDAEPVDVWGVGVIFYTLLVGNTPWDEPTDFAPEFRRYVRGEIWNYSPWSRIQGSARDLLCRLLTVDVSQRITLDEVLTHPWCQRQSQLPTDLFTRAQLLTSGLRAGGDLDIADPDLTGSGDGMNSDGETLKLTAPMASQFTQGLQLFSQTQGGTRYIAQLTRFYTSVSPDQLKQCIIAALQGIGGIKIQERQPELPAQVQLRVGGYDARKEEFQGWVRIELVDRGDKAYSLCIFDRSRGNPISWRQLWKLVATSPSGR